MSTCIWEECNSDSAKRGYCHKHYARFRRLGWPDSPEQAWEKSKEKVCGWPECSVARRIKRGLCPTHYSRSESVGHVENPWVVWSDGRLAPPRSCVWPLCDDEEIVGRQMCSRHYHWSKRAGFPSEPWVAHALKTGGISASEKLCNSCGIVKNRADFYPRVKGEYAVFPNCKSCTLMISRDRRKIMPTEQARHSRSAKFKRYGITEGEYISMLRLQNNRCKICGGVNQDGSDLAVDHDHYCCPGNESCGQCIRGLLCRKCNSGIGLLGDDPNIIRAAAAYIESYGLHLKVLRGESNA